MERILRIPCGSVNCYLVSNGENAILVDTCREKYRQKILDACKPFRVRLLVLTHGHVDHVQNAAFLSRELDCPVAMHRADRSLLTNNMNQPLSAGSFLGKIVLSASIKSFKTDDIPAFSPTVFVEDGDSLHDYGFAATCSWPSRSYRRFDWPGCRRTGFNCGRCVNEYVLPNGIYAVSQQGNYAEKRSKN